MSENIYPFNNFRRLTPAENPGLAAPLRDSSMFAIEEVKRLRGIDVDTLKEECAALGDFDDEDRQAAYAADRKAWHRDMAARHLAAADEPETEEDEAA